MALTYFTFLPLCLVAALCLPLAPALAQPATIDTPAQSVRSGSEPVSRDIDANLLILRVQLDGSTLSDGLTAYQSGVHILLPLGELARLLTLAITVQPKTGSASGYVLSEDRTFGLNVAQFTASLAGNDLRFEPQGARVIDEDIYVSSELLSRWLPINFEISLSALELQVKPRESCRCKNGWNASARPKGWAASGPSRWPTPAIRTPSPLIGG